MVAVELDVMVLRWGMLSMFTFSVQTSASIMSYHQPGSMIRQYTEGRKNSTQDCFTHDICSWFENATGGARYVSFYMCVDNY